MVDMQVIPLKLMSQFVCAWSKLFAIVFMLQVFSCSHEITIPHDNTNLDKRKQHSGLWQKQKAICTFEDELYNTSSHIDKNYRTFDFYEPLNVNKTLPLIIFVHSGAFVTGDKKSRYISNLAKDFARTGKFRTTSINYRLLDPIALNQQDDLLTLLLKGYTRRRIFEAVGDLSTAISYFTSNSSKFNIDATNVYIVGYSAGGIIVNSYLTSDPEEILELTGERRIDNLADDVASLFTKDQTSILQPDNLDRLVDPPSVKGAVSISGGILDYKHLDDDDIDIPTLMIHGDEDFIVPYSLDNPFKKFDNLVQLDIITFSQKVGYYDDRGRAVPIIQKYNTFGLGLPESTVNVVKSLTASPICGSECIKSGIVKSDNLNLVTIEGGDHTFMFTDDGMLTNSYYNCREVILRFLKSN